MLPIYNLPFTFIVHVNIDLPEVMCISGMNFIVGTSKPKQSTFTENRGRCFITNFNSLTRYNSESTNQK